MLCLSCFELNSRWVPLEHATDVAFLRYNGSVVFE